MHSQQDLHVMRQMTSEREAQLHETIRAADRLHPWGRQRRWLGGLIVRLGAWVAAEPTLRPATAR